MGMGIRRKFLFYILLPLIAILAILSIVFYFYSSVFLEERASLSLFSQVNGINNEIELYISEIKSDLGMLLSNRMIMDYFIYSWIGLLDYKEDARWKREMDFLKIAREKPKYAVLRLTGLDGISVVAIVNEKVNYQDIDSSKEDWFQKSLKLKEDESYVSPVHLCREHHSPGILVSGLYYDDLGHKRGIASLHVHLDEFFKELVKRKIGENGYVYLIDKRGLIVAHKDRRKIGLNVKNFQSTKNILAGEEGTITEIDEQRRALMKKAYIPTKVEGLGLVIAQPIRGILAFGAQFRLFNLVILVITVLLVSVVSYASIKKLTGPIKQLTEITGEVSKGRFDVEIDPKLKESKDELGQLATSFDQMTTDLKKSQEKLIRSEKLAILGKLAGIVSHELKNPLGTIRNSVYFLKMKLNKGQKDPKINKHLDILEQEVNASDKIITNILTFGGVKEPQFAKTNIYDLIKESLAKVQPPTSIKVVTDLNSDLPEFLADGTQLEEVFYNIILNSIQAMPTGGRLIIKGKKIGELIEVDIADTGMGIPQENLGKIFEPLFSTKAKGTGLGLSVCQNIIGLHKGTIEVKSEVGKGTKFIIRLPITKKEA